MKGEVYLKVCVEPGTLFEEAIIEICNMGGLCCLTFNGQSFFIRPDDDAEQILNDNQYVGRLSKQL